MKSMIKYLLAAAIALAGYTTVANAADQNAPRRQGQNRLEQLAKDLKLTDDQKAKMEEVFKKQSEKMRELRQDTALSQEDRRAKMRKIMEDMEPEIKKILTPDQFEQYQKARTQRRPGQGRVRGNPAK